MGECPPRQGWKKIHGPSIFTAMYKAPVIDLNFVQKRNISV